MADKKKKKKETTAQDARKKIESIVVRLTSDIKADVLQMTASEVRFLVDSYYGFQDFRIQVAGQMRAAEQEVDDQPVNILGWMLDNMKRLEDQMKGALGVYAEADPVGAWSRSICGIGPVLAAGLLAHIDMEQCPTAGHIWSYAGLVDKKRWIGRAATGDTFKKFDMSASGRKAVEQTTLQPVIDDLAAQIGVPADRLAQWARNVAVAKEWKVEEGLIVPEALANAAARRPWNARFKTLCWKIGESFVKVQNNEIDVYGTIYAARKVQEIKKNKAGEFADQAAAKLKRFNIGKSTDAYKAYSKGLLPDAHIHARAKRYAVKLFLAHWHEMAYKAHFKKMPPNPYPIAIQGHAHKIECPNKDMITIEPEAAA